MSNYNIDTRNIKTYTSARSLGNDGEIFLDANECQSPGKWRRYPNKQDAELKTILAGLYEVENSQILYDRGLDEIISLVMRAYCPPDSEVKIYPPTYGMYEVEASILGLRVNKIFLTQEGFIPIESELINPGTPALVIICRPNNPLGTVETFEKIELLAKIYKGIAPIFIDEAYAEFMSLNDQSAIALIGSYDIIVGRTFSKALGLAGMRFGCAIANSNLIEKLAMVQKPYPIATPVISYLLENLKSDIIPNAIKYIEEIKIQRPVWEKKLTQALGISPYASGANFLCFIDPGTKNIFIELKKAGIITRLFENEKVKWRITIGSPEQLEKVIRIIGAIA